MSVDIKKRKNCDNCDFKTLCQMTETRTIEVWLCDICYNTHLANQVLYPGSCTSAEGAIMGGIAYIGNLILSKLEK